MTILFASILAVTAGSIDIVTDTTTVVACLNNIGPELVIVCAAGNYLSLSEFAKLALCFDMLAGQLKIFPMLIIFTSTVWRK